MNEKSEVDLKAFTKKVVRDAETRKSFEEMVKYHDMDKDGKVSLMDFMMTLQKKTEFSQEVVECAICDFQEMQAADGFASFEKFKEVMEIRDLMANDKKKLEQMQKAGKLPKQLRQKNMTR